MGSMNRYKIRQQAQTPKRVNLRDPATGVETEDWLEIRSSLSDEFIQARDETMQAVQSLNTSNPEERKKAVAELQLNLKVALVSGWSFEEPCTPENVRDWLRDAPQVQMLILAVADNSAAFFGMPSEDSSSGPEKK